MRCLAQMVHLQVIAWGDQDLSSQKNKKKGNLYDEAIGV